MKTNILLFCTLLSAHVVFGQIPDYFGSNPTWLVHHYGGTPWTSFYEGKKLIFIDGDTSINNQSYHKLYQTGYFSEDPFTYPPPIEAQDYFDHVFYGLHRQDGRMIYAYNPTAQSESLLISYDYQVGDNVQSSVLNPDPIQDIDSMLIGAEYRRMFYTDTANGTFILEGIGYLTSSPEMFSSIYSDYPAFGVEALMNFCYAQNENPLYPYQPGGSVCTTEHLGIEVSDVMPGQLYFNATEKRIVVPDTDGEITIYVRDVCGKILAEGKEKELSLASLPAGYYFALVEGRQTLFFVIAD